MKYHEISTWIFTCKKSQYIPISVIQCYNVIHIINYTYIIPIGSMVLVYMLTWIPSIYPSHVSIYTIITWIRHGISVVFLVTNEKSMGISGSNRWRYVSTICLAIFYGDVPLHRPYIYRPYINGRYLQSIGSWKSHWYNVNQWWSISRRWLIIKHLS